MKKLFIRVSALVLTLTIVLTSAAINVFAESEEPDEPAPPVLSEQYISNFRAYYIYENAKLKFCLEMRLTANVKCNPRLLSFSKDGIEIANEQDVVSDENPYEDCDVNFICDAELIDRTAVYTFKAQKDAFCIDETMSEEFSVELNMAEIKESRNPYIIWKNDAGTISSDAAGIHKGYLDFTVYLPYDYSSFEITIDDESVLKLTEDGRLHCIKIGKTKVNLIVDGETVQTSKIDVVTEFMLKLQNVGAGASIVLLFPFLLIQNLLIGTLFMPTVGIVILISSIQSYFGGLFK